MGCVGGCVGGRTSFGGAAGAAAAAAIRSPPFIGTVRLCLLLSSPPWQWGVFLYATCAAQLSVPPPSGTDVGLTSPTTLEFRYATGAVSTILVPAHPVYSPCT